MTTSADAVERGYVRCAQITRARGTTYYWGALLLPRTERRHVFALYALARIADDIVDITPATPPEATARRLKEFEATFFDALESGEATTPIFSAIVATVRDCAISTEYFHRFFAAMETDLVRSTYPTWDDLLEYMDGSAAVIGEMMLPVLKPRVDALAPARSLGLAFQLTNFLRDVGEDLDRGRIYLPQEDLRAFGADPCLRKVTEPWRELMAFEIERNRRLYRAADEGLTALPPASRRCVVAARVLYARILDRIEAADYDVFSTRRRVSTPAKATVAARTLLHRDPRVLLPDDRAARQPGPGWGPDEEVVLIDQSGHATGSGRKSQIHHDDTPLHLAFSCYIFDPDGQVLVTRRAAGKASFPAVVTNSVCGHPLPGEGLEEAVRRRARDELGVVLDVVRPVLGDFRYTARMGTVVENEMCPVTVAVVSDSAVRPDPAEVAGAWWMPWSRFQDQVRSGELPVSPWCSEQVDRLAALGPDPAAWPTAPHASLPPAARSGRPDD